MKRKIVVISIFCLVFGSLFYVYYTKKNSWSDYLPNSPTEDPVFQNVTSEDRQNQGSTKTGFAPT